MRVKITRKRLFTPKEDKRLTVRFDEGAEVTTKREWAERLIAEGDAEEIPASARETGDAQPPKKAKAEA